MAEVIVSSIGYLKEEITAGRHALVADEPVEAGGSDEGPDPYSLLLGALGACTAMTIQMYAKRKGWPLEKVEVSLRHSRIHAEDCKECNTKEGKLSRIDKYISLVGPLSEEQRARLMEIADALPGSKDPYIRNINRRSRRLNPGRGDKRRKMYTDMIVIPTERDKQVLDITGDIEKLLLRWHYTDGLLNIFVRHTTAGITTGEAIEGTDEDLMETLEKMIPEIKFRHGHDPSHAPDHMISSIVGASLSIPVSGGRLLLGRWQRILFVECNGPREREVVVTAIWA